VNLIKSLASDTTHYLNQVSVYETTGFGMNYQERCTKTLETTQFGNINETNVFAYTSAEATWGNGSLLLLFAWQFHV
jgi:hypothetical protein